MQFKRKKNDFLQSNEINYLEDMKWTFSDSSSCYIVRCSDSEHYHVIQLNWYFLTFSEMKYNRNVVWIEYILELLMHHYARGNQL